MNRRTALIVFALSGVVGTADAGDDVAIAAARHLFDRYVAFERSFDPAAADLYADDARIVNRRRYPNGEVRELAFPAPRYKALLRAALPLAAARGDRNSYSNVSFTSEGTRVRIAATRFSELKRYDSPISWLVGRSSAGVWRIHEELSESRP